MVMTADESEPLRLITQLNTQGISELLQNTEEGSARRQELLENLIDITLAASRMVTAGPERYSLDEVLARFGYTREELANIPEQVPTYIAMFQFRERQRSEK
jgi:hypothetical protein